MTFSCSALFIKSKKGGGEIFRFELAGWIKVEELAELWWQPRAQSNNLVYRRQLAIATRQLVI